MSKKESRLRLRKKRVQWYLAKNPPPPQTKKNIYMYFIYPHWLVLATVAVFNTKSLPESILKHENIFCKIFLRAVRANTKQSLKFHPRTLQWKIMTAACSGKRGRESTSTLIICLHLFLILLLAIGEDMIYVTVKTCQQIDDRKRTQWYIEHVSGCYLMHCHIDRNIRISVLNGTLWDMGQVHCGICEIGLLSNFVKIFHAEIILKVFFVTKLYTYRMNEFIILSRDMSLHITVTS